jgi:hypothetical protein
MRTLGTDPTSRAVCPRWPPGAVEGRFIRVELELTWTLAQRAPIRGLDFPLPGKRNHPLRSRGMVPVPKPSAGSTEKTMLSTSSGTMPIK